MAVGVVVARVGREEPSDVAKEEAMNIGGGGSESLDDRGEGWAGDRDLRKQRMDAAVGGGGHVDRKIEKGC